MHARRPLARRGPLRHHGRTTIDSCSATTVLDYLATRALRDLPDEVWDSHLWLYGDLLPLLEAPLDGRNTDRITAYAALEPDGLAGIALAVAAEPGLHVQVHGRSPAVAVELAQRCTEQGGTPAELSAVSLPQIEAIRSSILPGGTVVPTRKLWTRTVAAPHHAVLSFTVRELTAGDAGLFGSLSFADGRRGWPGFRGSLGSGLRYFGAFVQGRLASLAGLCRLSRLRSEIIGVQTFLETDRRRGYATAVCREALEAALRDARICTWTAREDNAASIRIAELLGMREYLTRYDLCAPTTR